MAGASGAAPGGQDQPRTRARQQQARHPLLEPVKEVVGRWNFQDISPKDLLGCFNAFAKAIPAGASRNWRTGMPTKAIVALPLTGSPGVLLFHTHGWLFRSVRRPSPHPRAPRLDRRSQPAPRCLDASAMRRAGRKCNDVAPVGRKRLPDRQTHARYLDRWNPSSGDVGRADAGRRPAVVRVPGMRSTLPARVLTGGDRLQAMSPSSACSSTPAAADARRGPRGAVKAQARRLRCATVRAAAGTQARLQSRLSR